MPKFSVRGVWQRWRESYPKDGSKADDAITLFTGVRSNFEVYTWRFTFSEYSYLSIFSVST